jgi:hypothetical protein
MMNKCPECGTDVPEGKPCPDCGRGSKKPKPSFDGVEPPEKAIIEEPMGAEGKCDKCGKPLKDGKCKDGCGSKGKKDSVDRVDYWGDLNAQATMSEALEATSNGALVGKAAIFGVGVYRYMGADGKVTSEFRPPEEVFSEETLDSYELVPLTNNHPTEKVTPENYKQYAVGSLGEEIEHDAYNAYAELSIYDAQAIQAVKAGRTGLSGGYSCDVVTEGEVSYPILDWDGKEISRTVYKIPGNFNGTPYDAIQTNIRGNHVALVDVPRGGDALHLRFDGADVGVGVRISEPKPIPTNHKEDHMVKIKLDGQQEHEIPEAVKAHIDSLDSKVSALASEKSSLQAKVDSAIEELEAAKQDAKAKEDGFQSKVAAAVEAKIAMASLASKHGVKADGDVRLAIINKAFPKANMDGKDDAYVAARFDSAIELLDAQGEQHTDGTSQQLQQLQTPKADGVEPESVEARMTSAYKSSK